MVQFFQNIWEAISGFFEALFFSFTSFKNATSLIFNTFQRANTYYAAFGEEFLLILSWIIAFSFIWFLLRVWHG